MASTRLPRSGRLTRVWDSTWSARSGLSSSPSIAQPSRARLQKEANRNCTTVPKGEHLMSTAINITDPIRLSNGHVHEVVSSAERELRDLLRQRAEIMRRMGTIKQALVYLAKTFGDDVLTQDVLPLLGR